MSTRFVLMLNVSKMFYYTSHYSSCSSKITNPQQAYQCFAAHFVSFIPYFRIYIFVYLALFILMQSILVFGFVFVTQYTVISYRLKAYVK